MKKADVKIGGTYWARVGSYRAGPRVLVRVESESTAGGWNVTLLSSGKAARIPSTARLLEEAPWVPRGQEAKP
jgi:hypothetical protein